MGIANALENKEPIDWPTLMINHFKQIADPKPGSHQLPFGNLLTTVFKSFNAHLGEGITLNRNDIFTRSTLDLPLQQQLDSNARVDRVLQLLLPYSSPSKALVRPPLNTLFQFLVLL
ncbi:hypothetical protein R3W88_011689 [Solanum pinnatisectum]|uniref:Uncharacterized protein n=1 Tax=Solanum pinnatisectum TaxID=50273 RepID=A0AAV9L7B5_9SOLN|nr:hypothetical protein R3W88_011689 [Solanum pinnatisectum]